MVKIQKVSFRQSYTKTIDKLSRNQRFKKTQNGVKKARMVSRKIKTIEGRLVREATRKLTAIRLSAYSLKLAIYEKVLSQKLSDTNKIYSPNEPHGK